jgi:hypothetical protein
MRLNDALVTSFNYGEKEYDINLAFDAVLDAFDYLNDETLRDYEKAVICLSLLLGEQDYEPSIDFWNYIYDEFIRIEAKKPIEYDLKGNPMPVQEGDNEDVHMDLEQDAELIYASFMQAYNINLYEQQGKMHWQEFRSLLNGLPTNTIMQRIVQIRAWRPQKGDSDETKENMRKLQKIHALKDREVEE